MNRKYGFLIIFSLSILINSFFLNSKQNKLDFNQVVIWGHKLHTSTHSYVHWGFYRGFKNMGLDTYWFDNKDNLSNFDFSKSLFIAAGQDENIPLRNDCFYILHNCYKEKYRTLFENNHCIILQVYTYDVLEREVQKIQDCIYYDIKNKIIYQPWATDLLPHEIDQIKKEIKIKQQTKIVHFIGTIWGGVFGNIPQIEAFKRACKENNIEFIKSTQCNMEKNIELIQESYMAPALQGKWQCEKGYIPCRIFKNISYGQMGITNSKTVYDLFKGKIVYNEDPYQLFYDAKQKIETMNIDELYELMDFVRDNHTYINRINTLLDFFELVINSQPQK